ncbi:hypothetical protein [Streptomyces sp. gb14]|uniref:hypothetical protein n=1 Tax=Streptomyces sp. gb14 TaxID=1827753 RepID=UPI000BF1BC46|nr:hypothetical protein [Streptomyces sp. gb14]
MSTRELRVTHRGRALAAPRPLRATELRRRLFLLSVRIHWQPFWSTPAARGELRRLMAGDQKVDAA